jgi:hypothetical protein
LPLKVRASNAGTHTLACGCAALPPESAERVMLRKLDYLAGVGAVPGASEAAQKALDFLTESSVAMRRLNVDVTMASVRETLDASTLVVTFSLQQGHAGTLLWASWFVGGEPGEDKAKGPQVGRFALNGALLQSLEADAALLRTKQKRKHVDVSYLDNGLTTQDLVLRVVKGTRGLLEAPLQVLASYLMLCDGIENIVLVCDRELCVLPLEACAPFNTGPAISRDFSLAMHMHRRKTMANVDKGSMRYIVDPRNEDVEGGYVGTVKRVNFTTTCQAFTNDLQSSFSDGVIGSDHIPSKAEWQRTVSGASLFLYQGPGPLLCHMSPGLLSSLNLSNCQCVVLMDRAENEVSERRQNKLDTSILPSLVQLRGKNAHTDTQTQARAHTHTYTHAQDRLHAQK